MIIQNLNCDIVLPYKEMDNGGELKLFRIWNSRKKDAYVWGLIHETSEGVQDDGSISVDGKDGGPRDNLVNE